MIIGSHVSMSGKDMLLASVKEALSYGANTFMFYTGAPQNTRRKETSELKIEEAKALMEESGMELKNIVVHAPYIINLANTVKKETYELAITFLKQELQRCADIGTSILVLHPGSHVQAGEDVGLKQIVRGLNEVLKETPYQGKIALETMAGKGSELGTTFEQLKYIIDHCDYPEKLGICLDTCHIHDAGYDLAHFDDVLDEFDVILGLDQLLVVHLNDSKNVRGARKDRHANLGHGEIGFDILNRIAHHDQLKDVPKILETPYINQKAPYKEEIEMLKNQTFTNIE
ncbi:MAG: deoxyribonuclease IV [Faecalibacillus sp.]